MQKIVLISDSQNVKLSTIDFACYLANLSHSELKIVLINNTEFEIPAFKISMSSYLDTGEILNEGPQLVEIEQTSKLIKNYTSKKGIHSSISVNTFGPSETTIYESRFADLLVVEPDISFLGDENAPLSNFVRHILAKSECPVVLAPYSFKYVDRIVFCYDGSASSLYAMKQFTYLFPEYKSTPVTLLEVRNSIIKEIDESHTKTIEWSKSHYENADIIFLNGEVSDELFPFFLNKQHIFIVMGAFGRSILSNLFHHSASEKVISTIDLPLFVAHH